MVWDELAVEESPVGANARERIRVAVDNAHAALAIVSGSDMVAVAPKRLALSRAKALGLKVIDVPRPLRTSAVFEAVWRADQSTHPALSWLRGILRDAAKQA